MHIFVKNFHDIHLRATNLNFFNSMAMEAIMALREKGGSSSQSVTDYVMQKYDLGDNKKAVKDKMAQALR
jgi:hypothetical protein